MPAQVRALKALGVSGLCESGTNRPTTTQPGDPGQRVVSIGGLAHDSCYPSVMDWIVSLVPEVAKDVLAALAHPPEGAAVVELRADRFPDLDIALAVKACPLPVLLTLRSTAEGGEGPVDSIRRKQILSTARDAGVALIDLEHRRDGDLIAQLGLAPEQVVLSWHDTEGTPSDLDQLAENMGSSPARFLKIVPTCRSLRDLETVLALHRRHNNGPRNLRRVLAFSMGLSGIASRYLAPLLGPPMGFAAWSEGAAAAPGQLTIERLDAVLSHLSGPPQRLFGVVGTDVSRSLSPVLHGAGYRRLGLPYLMVPLSVPDPEDLQELFVPLGHTCLDRVGFPARGWAVTTPYKAQAAKAAHRCAPRVRRAGAANTLILGHQGLVAENTDADGVVGSLVASGIDLPGRTAVVQGTGGAGRGAAVGLHLAGAEVYLRSRSAERARTVAEEIGVGWCASDTFPEATDVVVNATPLGLDDGEPAVFSDREISGALAVVDMVYGDRRTSLVESAIERGILVADGREVLLHQGYAQFAAFTNNLPPKKEMREAVRPSEFPQPGAPHP